MMDAFLHDSERIDDLGRRGYRILQKPEAFCFGMDAVLLADFAYGQLEKTPLRNRRVLDLCTGSGIVPILMEARIPEEMADEVQLEGLELQEEIADMASRSVQMNDLSDHISIRWGDVKDIQSLYTQNRFDMVTVNPPYMEAPGGLKNDLDTKTIARHEVACTLSDVLDAAQYVLKSHGKLCMVHRPRRLVQLMTELTTHHLEPKTIQLVQPYADKEPNLVLIEAVKQGRPELKVLPPLIVYEKPGIYTREILDIYGLEQG